MLQKPSRDDRPHDSVQQAQINSFEVRFSVEIGYPQMWKTIIEVLPMTIGQAVTARILNLCRERNISINKLCTMSGVTQSTVNNIISGRNHSVTVSTIQKLCEGLGITIEDFFHSELFRNLEQEPE